MGEFDVGVSMNTVEKSDSQIIDAAGGTAIVARLCDVSMQAVSNWREAGIPHARRMYLRAVRPEAFFPEAGFQATDAMGDLRIESVPQVAAP